MDFFKSVFSPDQDPSDSPSDSPRHPHDDDDGRHEEEEVEEAVGEEEEDAVGEEEEEEADSENPNPSQSSGSWNWLVKTITTRSESVIQTYRRDLEEFGSGLKKETEAIKEVATRAVRDLPGSLEVGASVAQESLESVGQVMDDIGGTVWRGTAEIISQGKEALLAVDADTRSPDHNPADPYPASSSKRYSRFEVQVLAIQNDQNTYVEEPEDVEDFEKWKPGFKLEEKEEEIEVLMYDNGVLEGFFENLVPGVVDQDTFWSRYFYRVYKLKQAEDARAKFVARVISREEDEEDLSWEVDDDEEEVESNKEVKPEEEEEKSTQKIIAGTKEEEKSPEEKKPTEEATKEEIVEISEKPIEELTKKEVEETPGTSEEEKKPTEASQVENLGKEENAKSKIEGKAPLEPKLEPSESSKDKDSDFCVVSSQPSMQEDDDLGWDEIEDLGEHEDKKVEGSSGSPRKIDLRKRLSAAEDDEDLSWDIEEDDDVSTKT